MKITLVAIFIFCSFCQAFTQVKPKIEHEKSVKKSDFPEKCIDLLKPILKESKSDKYYKEFDGENYFYELKTTYNSKQFSIKFTESGHLVDIEYVYDFEQLTESLKEEMSQFLKEQYKKHKIERFQLQYNPEIDDDREEEDDKDFLEDFLEMDLDDLILHYEMEVEVLTYDGESKLLELLFDNQGSLIQQREVQRRDEDFILY